MKKYFQDTVALTLAGLWLVALVGCGSSTTEPTSTAPVQTVQTVQAACAACVYKMPGVESCQLAVKIDGTPYLVTGVSVEPHNIGLCEGEKSAEVTGQVQDGKFVAQSFALK